MLQASDDQSKLFSCSPAVARRAISFAHEIWGGFRLTSSRKFWQLRGYCHELRREKFRPALNKTWRKQTCKCRSSCFNPNSICLLTLTSFFRPLFEKQARYFPITWINSNWKLTHKWESTDSALTTCATTWKADNWAKLRHLAELRPIWTQRARRS